MAISGRAVLAVALGVVPVVLLGGQPGAPWAVAGGWLALVAALVALDLSLAASPRRVAVARELPDRTRLDETVPLAVEVTNLGPRRLRAVVRDHWEPTSGLADARLAVDVPPGERRVAASTLTPRRRGERRTAAVTVRAWGPLGLGARQATLSAPARLRVLPPFRSRRHLPSRLARLRELDGSTSVQIRGAGTEFDSLRDYVRGDDVRSIDWRATARRRDVVVRTWRPERDRRVVLVLDSSRTQAARVGDETRFDTAVEATLLLAALASSAGDRVDALAYDRRVRARVQGQTGAGLLAALVDGLSVVEPDLIEMDWSAVPSLVRSATTQRALVVLLTSLESPGASEPLLAMLPRLTGRHQVVVAVADDGAVTDAAAGRGDAEDVYRAAAAERTLADRARLATAVSRLGGQVVHAGPEALPPALADHYLALKAAGRL